MENRFVALCIFLVNCFILMYYYFRFSELMKCNCYLAAPYCAKRHTEIEEYVAVKQLSL